MQITNRWTDETIYDAPDATTMREAVMLALKHGAVLRRADLSDAVLSDADLRGADLSDADLRGADLRRAVLSDADLRGADLRRAVLSDADLRDADLRDADLSGAVLSDADLRRADLSGAVLSDADLSGAVLRRAVLSDADLRRADLSGAVLSDAVLSDAVLRRAVLRRADLRGADLSDAKEDVISILNIVPNEVAGLRLALVEGRVNGQMYRGECACLVGTIANLRHCHHTSIPGLHPDPDRPAERLFLAIRQGDTPESNPIAQIVVGWIDEWLAAREAVPA
jgi:uncharacterized protein YjbI with pentapeptide repeats